MACETVLHIDGNVIPLRVSRLTSFKYRLFYRRSLDRDVRDVEVAVQTNGRDSNIPVPVLQRYLNIVHLMAWEADPQSEKDPDKWIERFDSFNIFDTAPSVISLWREYKGADPDQSSTESVDIAADNSRARIQQRVTDSVTRKCRDAAVQSVTVNEHMGMEERGHYIALVYLEWRKKFKKKRTMEKIMRYSSDVAMDIAVKCPDVQELVIFWHIPTTNHVQLKHVFVRDGMKLIRTK